MFRSIGITLALCLATFAAQAALVGRAALTPGGTDYQAYYDTATGLTWVADANLAKTLGFNTPGAGLHGAGFVYWRDVPSFLAALNGYNGEGYLGFSNWRLPASTDTGNVGCDLTYSGTDCGYNVDVATGEMANLFYGTLGNIGWFDASGTETGCGPADTFHPNRPSCLANSGPFTNIVQSITDRYTSGTLLYPTANPVYVWEFDFLTGIQYVYPNGFFNPGGGMAWVMADGDVLASTVPIPPAVWLFGSALGLMGVMRRKVAVT